MLKFIGYGVLLLVVGLGILVAIASRRPDTFEVSRAVSIKALPERIFPLINDMRAFNAWNPFAKSDPDMKLVYSGPQAGPGANIAFGPGKGGKGTLTIVEATAPGQVVMRLDMDEPIEAHNRIDFVLQSQGDATRVSWSMKGSTPLIAKVIHTVIDMDRMVGGQMQTGLADLKAIAEKQP